jgi:pimeloyl-ACP methyl ester carboxylesterase
MSFKRLGDSNGKPRGMSFDQYIDTKVDELTNPWMLNYIKIDPTTYFEFIKCPVLVLHGEKDLEVPTESNILSIKNSFNKAQHNSVTIKVLPKLNHLLQESKTGLPSEYASITEIISTSALDQISDWVNEQFFGK